MKHFLSFCMIVCCLCVLPFTSKAQNTLSIPNGDFESWTYAPGYTLQIPFGSGSIEFPIFYGFSYPSLWNYPTLYVNETFDYSMIGEINLNTNVPLIKVGSDTDNVSEGNIALMLQTFKIADIMEPSIYNILESSIDETLTSMTIPSILCNGTLHVDNFFSLLANILNNADSLDNFISSFDGVDLNEYISGGMALNDFVPGKVTGLYKYASATIGDNGGVLLLGSKYDTTLQRRVVVGGGVSIDMTDASSYTPFEVYYHAAEEIDSNMTDLQPDTLVILLLSSASSNIQQYSTLYLDGLTLWEADSNDVENSCSRAYFISLSDVDTTSAQLTWFEFESPNFWEVEYGLQDFIQGTGTVDTTTTTELSLTNLQTDTYYDVYVRGVCEDSLYSNWSSFRFKTASPVPEDTTGIQNITDDNILIFPNPAHGNCTLQFNEQQPSSIQLYAIDGKLLQTITPDNSTINLSLPYSGIFLLRCETEKGVMLRRIINFK